MGPQFSRQYFPLVIFPIVLMAFQKRELPLHSPNAFGLQRMMVVCTVRGSPADEESWNGFLLFCGKN